MNYRESISYIRETAAFGSKLGLENITTLMSLLDDPQDTLRIIHIAGTNGKGSVASYILSALKKAGYRSGLYTSPELERFTERIRINEREISREDVAKYATLVRSKAEYMSGAGMGQPTEFELVMAMAFCYFADRKVDAVVLETGMGGRLDATNVIRQSMLSVITKISYDHMQYLGDSLDKIAMEKAGIIKEGGQVLVYPQQEEVMQVYKEVCGSRNATLHISSLPDAVPERRLPKTGGIVSDDIFREQRFILDGTEYETGMRGIYERENAALAINALDLVSGCLKRLDRKAIYEGIREAAWPGRFEVLSKEPLIIADGAHNVDGAEALSGSLERYFGDKKVCLVLGILKDKQYDRMLEILLKHASAVIACKVPNPRSLDTEGLEKAIKKIRPDMRMIQGRSLEEVIEEIKKPQPDAVANVICGSLYLVGPLRRLILNEPAD